MRRYLAAYLPWLPTERAVRANCVPPDVTIATVSRVRGREIIVAISAAAQSDLIGLPIADALVREPRLHTVFHDAAADRALLEWVADSCEIFTPTISLDPPDRIMLDITGCCGRFAGESDLANAVARRLQRFGLTSSLGIGGTPDAAAALARFTEVDIGDLPLAALRVDPHTRSALSRTGLTTIGALASQPRSSLTARFGPAVTTSLGRLLGEEDVRLVPRRSLPPIFAEHRFADPVSTVAVVRTALDRLVFMAVAQLAAQAAGGRRFAAELFRSDGHVARLNVDTGTPTRDAGIISRLLDERIESLADPIDPGFGFDMIRFSVPAIEALGSAQLQLGGRIPGDAEISALLDRLRTRLGDDRVRRLACGDSHVPERTAFDVPALTASASTSTSPHGTTGLRPLHLFAPPQPIDVIAEVPDGPPRGFRWQQLRHDVTRAEGPERIAAEWWQHAGDGGTTRDYYRVEDSQGRRYWLFRHGLYGSEKASPRWYLHGIFA